MESVDNATFHTNNDINRLISETEHLFTVYLESGDRQKAMKRLRVPPLGEQRSPWITFKVGLFSGSFIVLSVTVILSGWLRLLFRQSWRKFFQLGNVCSSNISRRKRAVFGSVSFVPCALIIDAVYVPHRR